MEYTLERSQRRTLAIQIKDGKVIVRAPMRVKKATVDRFVTEHVLWIEKKLKLSSEREERLKSVEKISDDELTQLKKRAERIIPEIVERYAKELGVSFGKITVRHQLTRWGSCSGKGNLSFNCLLVLAPREVLESVVAHELCHLIEMNHSRSFYEKLYGIFPEYKKCSEWLRSHGQELIERIR